MYPDQQPNEVYQPTDFSLPENEAEKQKLLQETVLPAVLQHLKELIAGLSHDSSREEDDRMDYAGMRAAINSALNEPLIFVQVLAQTRMYNHYEAAMMVRDYISENEATQLIESALAQLKISRQQLQQL